MLQVIAMVVGVLAMIAWLSAAVHCVMLLPHRRDDISLFSLAFQGWRFFARGTWKGSGQTIHTRFVVSAVAFLFLVMAGIVISALAASMSR